MSVSEHTTITGSFLTAIIAVACLATSIANPARGQCEIDKLIASDGAMEDRFGLDCALTGDVAVIGADWDDDNGENSGSAYVFRFDADLSQWLEVIKLTASDGAAGDSFGVSVGISGGVAVIGAFTDSDVADQGGSAYVFRYDGSSWLEEAALHASDAEADDQFGLSVAISGEAIIVGARKDDDHGPSSGAAYIFRYNGVTWIEEAKLTASDGAEGDEFGRSVAIHNDVAIAGAVFADAMGGNSGAAYVYEYDGSGWNETKLTASDGAADDWFGFTVAAGPDVVVAGAQQANHNGVRCGAAYVYQFDGANWIEVKIGPSDGEGGDRFGRDVAINGDILVIGASANDENGIDAGAAYVYRREGQQWVEERKLLAALGMPDDRLGISAAVNTDFVLLGAYQDDDAATDAGAVLVYDFAGEDCNDNGVCDRRELALGVGEDCNENLIPDDCDIADHTSEDCNDNGVPDECDIDSGFSDDCNANGIPDECECLADVDDDGLVNIDDIMAVLGAWGQPGGPADVNCDGKVNIDDVFVILGGWGPC